MEDAGFVDVKGEQILIPLYVPDGQGLRDLFPFMVKSTPLDVSEHSAYSRVEPRSVTNTQKPVYGRLQSSHSSPPPLSRP